MQDDLVFGGDVWASHDWGDEDLLKRISVLEAIATVFAVAIILPTDTREKKQ